MEEINYAFSSENGQVPLISREADHRPIPGKGFVFKAGKPLRVLGDTRDLTGHRCNKEGC